MRKARWIASYYKDNREYKIGDTSSSFLHMHGAMPEGALLGMESFCEMIHDLLLLLPVNKYVVDSTTFVWHNKGDSDRLKTAIQQAVRRTMEHSMSIDVGKTNEMILSSAIEKSDYPKSYRRLRNRTYANRKTGWRSHPKQFKVSLVMLNILSTNQRQNYIS